MAILKSTVLVAAFATAVCTTQKPESEIAGVADIGPATNTGWIDIHIQAEEAVVGNFAGFFDVLLRTTHIEDGAVVQTDLERGTIALTFKEFASQPVSPDQPIDFNGMFILSRDKYPSHINFTARQRKQRRNSFNVSLSGINESESVGVATVNRDTIFIRLVDDGPNTTVLTLRRQTSRANQTAADSVEQINFGPAKPYVPDGSPTL